jgi:hypothetical protein
MFQKLTHHLKIAALVVLTTSAFPSLTQPAFAQNVTWTDWTSFGNGQINGSLTFPDESPIEVTFRGSSYFVQTGDGTNYWNPSTAYISSTVPNAPTPSEMIGSYTYDTKQVNTITFSTPVENPVFAIVGLGGGSWPNSYKFDSPFDILSSRSGYDGNGSLVELPGNVLEEKERPGNGVIQFQGIYSSISWTVPSNYALNGFTVGAKKTKTVPEPTTALCLLFLGGLGAVSLKRKGQNFNSNN